MPDYRRKYFTYLLRRAAELSVLCLQKCTRLPLITTLVKLRIFKAYRKTLEIIAHYLGRDRCDERRIDPAAKVSADRNISAEAYSRSIEHQSKQLFGLLRLRLLRQLFCRRIFGSPILTATDLPILQS